MCILQKCYPQFSLKNCDISEKNTKCVTNTSQRYDVDGGKHADVVNETPNVIHPLFNKLSHHALMNRKPIMSYPVGYILAHYYTVWLEISMSHLKLSVHVVMCSIIS
jgi:hypothetical protein